jgi:choice-of-anchor B domain-containing protein
MKIKILLLFLIFVNINFTKAKENISIVGKLEITGLPVHDVWGYTDPETEIRYALIAASTSGLRIIDLSDPINPEIVGSISGSGIRAIDVKTWKNYAYIVGESTSVPGKIIDLSDPANPIQVGMFTHGHNITISDGGIMYLSGPGIRVLDLNDDPTNPTQIFYDGSCRGHDISIIGDRLFDFSDNCGTRVFDFGQSDTLVSLGGVPDSGIFHHSGWTSEDGNYLYICDELAKATENDITVWDISDLESPVMVDSFADPNANVHNLYVRGNYAYVSYYRAGFRLFDISDPLNMELVAQYDTDPNLSGLGYGGNFGIFTNWGEDMILASDEENGLYVFNVSGLITGIDVETNDRNNDNLMIYPNPAAEKINLEFLDNTENRIIKIYNSFGEELFIQNIGRNKTANISTENFNSGVYYIEIVENNNSRTRKLIISK